MARRTYTTDPATAARSRIESAARPNRPNRDTDDMRAHHLLSGLTEGSLTEAQAAVEARERTRAARAVIRFTAGSLGEDGRAECLAALGIGYDDAQPEVKR